MRKKKRQWHKTRTASLASGSVKPIVLESGMQRVCSGDIN